MYQKQNFVAGQKLKADQLNHMEDGILASVSTEIQVLTPAQQAQARANIGIVGTGEDGADGVSCTHSWSGTVLTITSKSGTSSADLKGPPGDRGEAGPQGATPVKGTDYYTEADKAEMVEMVLAALPMWEEGGY